ncbi:MAG: TonB-dependent receptor, partial [Methylocystis sp.]
EIDQTVNVMTSAEAIQNMPSTLVRERFIGDRNAVIEGRINNPQDSARTALYADGVLLSNYLGNSFAYPPRWNMVAPVEIERVDVMQGPFSALYGGNSESGVYTISTRMPEHFEFHAEGNSSAQFFTWFQDKETDIAGHMSVAVGDRMEKFSYWLIYDRLDAQGQAQTFSQNQFSPTCTAGKCLSAVGGVFSPYVAGGTAPNGFPTPGGTLGDIAGSAGADHSEQHFGKVKLAYDFSPTARLSWQTGFWSLVDNTFVQPYQYTTSGVPLYGLGSGVKINDGPFGSYGLGALNPTHSNSSHLMNTLEFKTDSKGVFDMDLVGTQYNFLRDYTNTYSQYGIVPTGATSTGLPIFGAGAINPTGSNVNQGGNFWRTFDARFIYRPEWDFFGKHILSFGMSDWLYSLNSVQTNTDVATANYYYDIQTVNYGKTNTKSTYVQDEWKFLPQWRLTLGARGDWWKAFDGSNDSLGNVIKASPDPLVTYAAVYKGAFSPKGALEYQVTPDFLVRGSIDRSYRFPTVAEMFQAISTSNTVTMNNPNLQPEATTYYDLSAEYHWHNAFDGKVGMITPRLSLFNADSWNYIYSQSNTIGATTLSQTLNIDKVNFHGIEGVLSANDIYWHGLGVTASATFTDAKILGDSLAPWFIGNQVPRIPRIRLHGTISYAPTNTFSVAATMRFATGSFVSLANTDFSHDTYGSTDSSYLVFDAKAQYKFAQNWTATAGINNIGNNKALVNPNPYPERTYFLGVKYDFGGPEKGQASNGVESLRASGASGGGIQAR